MSRIIQRLAAFVILSSLFLSGCGSRTVSVSGLHAEKADDGVESRLNFKIRNPTGIEVALTTITIKTLDKGQDDEGNPLKFVYSYAAVIHRVYTDDQGKHDDIVKEVRIPTGKIIEFKPGGEYYVKLVPTKLENPEVDPQKGLPHGYLMQTEFSLQTIRKDDKDPKLETRNDMASLWLEAFIK